MIVRRAEICPASHRNEVPWIVVNPFVHEDETSPFALDDWTEVCSLSDVAGWTVTLCEYGAENEMATDLMGIVALDDAEDECSHPTR